MKRFIELICVCALAAVTTSAQQSVSPPPIPGSPNSRAAPPTSADFIKAADEVLAQMSKLLDLPIKEPLKKSLRSKQDIREYLIREEKENRNDAQRYADTKALEAFGLIPRGFPLDSFMLDVLTDQ